jgi:hypothetical protein
MPQFDENYHVDIEDERRPSVFKPQPWVWITCPGCGERLRVTTGSIVTLIPHGAWPDVTCIRIDTT